MDLRGDRLEERDFPVAGGGGHGAVQVARAAPYFGAILWGRRRCDHVQSGLSPGRRPRSAGAAACAATSTLLIVLGLVIVQALLLGVALVEEATQIYTGLEDGQLDVAAVLGRLRDALLLGLPATSGPSGPMPAGCAKCSRVRFRAARAISPGRRCCSARAPLNFLAALRIMLYLTFFPASRRRDSYGRRSPRRFPLDPDLRERLSPRDFVTVVRATMKGSIVVAVIQGILGGVIFWLLGIEGALLWGLLMGLFSLVPAVRDRHHLGADANLSAGSRVVPGRTGCWSSAGCS